MVRKRDDGRDANALAFAITANAQGIINHMKASFTGYSQLCAAYNMYSEKTRKSHLNAVHQSGAVE